MGVLEGATGLPVGLHTHSLISLESRPAAINLASTMPGPLRRHHTGDRQLARTSPLNEESYLTASTEPRKNSA